jgi:hypothetical protein
MTHAKFTNRTLARTLGAVACVAAALTVSNLGSAAGANAQPNSGTWDLEAFDACTKQINYFDEPFDYWKKMKACCVNSGGVWKETPQGIGDCVAPPATSPGSGQLPGKVRIPPDLSAVPVTPVQPPPDGAVSPPLTNAG